MFGFKTIDTRQVQEVIERFCILKHQVPDIVNFEWGQNNSPENLNQGHSHCFTLSFESTDARDVYLVHPEHQAFAQWVGQWVETVTVLDYWATEVS
jgi:hypothetical protein